MNFPFFPFSSSPGVPLATIPPLPTATHSRRPEILDHNVRFYPLQASRVSKRGFYTLHHIIHYNSMTGGLVLVGKDYIDLVQKLKVSIGDFVNEP